MTFRNAICAAHCTNLEDIAEDWLERTLPTNKGQLTNLTNLVNIIMRSLKKLTVAARALSPGAIETLKQSIDWNVDNIQSGYDILMAGLELANVCYS